MNFMLAKLYLELAGVNRLLVEQSKAWLNIHDCTAKDHGLLLPDQARVPVQSPNKLSAAVTAQSFGAISPISSPTAPAEFCANRAHDEAHLSRNTIRLLNPKQIFALAKPVGCFSDSDGGRPSTHFWTGGHAHLIQGDACAPFRRHTA